MDKSFFPFGEEHRKYYDGIKRRIARALEDLPFDTSSVFWQRAYPLVNTYESEDDVILRCELPGVRKEDMDISMTGRTLTISGREHKDADVADFVCHRRERHSGEFCRSIQLPDTADPEGTVKARLSDGVLEVKIPKRQKHQAKKISVSD